MDDGVELTELLGRAQAGDAAAADAVFRATYDELRYIAHVRLGSGRRNTLLDTTALVHEWFLRFARTHGIRIEDRRHFMRYAARAMRTIIVDFARERAAARRGGGEPSLPLLGTEAMPAQGPEEILTVHRALVEPGPVLKRFKAGAKGSAKPRVKRMSHLRIVLTDGKSN